MKSGLTLAFGLGLVLVVASSCGPQEKNCGPANCAGCCDSAGTCQTNQQTSACGLNGFACTSCLGAQVCVGGLCAGNDGTGSGGGSGSGGGGSGGGGSSEYATLCNQYASAVCDRAITCKSAEASGRPSCLKLIKLFYCPNEASLQKGYATLNTSKLSACLTQVQSASDCDNATSTECYGFLNPAVVTGKACLSSSDCISADDACAGTGCAKTCQPTGTKLGAPCRSGCDVGLACDDETSRCKAGLPVGAACKAFQDECGATSYCSETTLTCTANPGPGQPCQNYRCGAGAYCDYATPKGICRAELPIGASCGTTSGSACGANAFCNYSVSPYICKSRGGQGAACTSKLHCQDPLTCRNKSCQAPLAEGQTCADYDACGKLYCDTTLRTCRKYTLVPKGGACTTSTQFCGFGTTCVGAQDNEAGGVGHVGICEVPTLGSVCKSHSSCPDGAFCNKTGDASSSGVCQQAVLGSPCDSSWHCQTNHACSTSTRTCTVEPGVGQVCGDVACAGNLACVKSSETATTGVCAELKSSGGSCIHSNECLFPNGCVGGTCKPVGNIGQACYSTTFCFDGYCQKSPSTSLCVAPTAVGGACAANSNCASKQCLAGTCAAACF